MRQEGIDTVEQRILRLKATPLTFEELEEVLDVIPGDFIGHRDKALFLTGWCGALRRSELVSVKVEDIEDRSEGIIVHKGRGRAVAIPFISDLKFCAVRALRRWRNLSRINEGHVFRAVGPGGKSLIYETSERPITGRMVSLAVKKYCKLAGFDSDKYSGDSLRAGFIASAGALGVHKRAVMMVARPKSSKLMDECVKDGRIFLENPLYTIFKSPVVKDWEHTAIQVS